MSELSKTSSVSARCEMRDAGYITAAEYELVKADLLAGRLCQPCRTQFQSNAEWLSAGRVRLSEMRQSGHDPAHGGEAAEKRAKKVSAENRRSHEWNRKHETRPEPGKFTRETLPSLQRVSLKEMRAAIGLSIDYCSKIRRGLSIPHPRHWDRLRTLILQDLQNRER